MDLPVGLPVMQDPTAAAQPCIMLGMPHALHKWPCAEGTLSSSPVGWLAGKRKPKH